MKFILLASLAVFTLLIPATSPALVVEPGLFIGHSDVVGVEAGPGSSVYLWLSVFKIVEVKQILLQKVEPLTVVISVKSPEYPSIPVVKIVPRKNALFFIEGQTGTKIQVSYPTVRDAEMVLKSFEGLPR